MKSYSWNKTANFHTSEWKNGSTNGPTFRLEIINREISRLNLVRGALSPLSIIRSIISK